MKQEKIWCDICGKEMGERCVWVSTFGPLPSLDDSFYYKEKNYRDFCQECINRLQKVVEEEVKKIKEEKK